MNSKRHLEAYLLMEQEKRKCKKCDSTAVQCAKTKDGVHVRCLSCGIIYLESSYTPLWGPLYKKPQSKLSFAEWFAPIKACIEKMFDN